MKKILALIMALIMLCLCAFTFVACGDDDKDDKDDKDVTTTKEPTPIPAGYKKFDNGDIYFGYPESWSKMEQSGVSIIMGTTNTNNITVAGEAKTDLYENMDVDEFDTLIKPQLTAQGITVTNVAISNVQNDNGAKITKITLNASVQGITMKQTMLILSTDDKTYCVTITEATTDSDLVSNVFETLNYCE